MTLKYFSKLKNNYNFSSKFIINYGIHLGGHIHLIKTETSSIIYGIRTQNVIINLNLMSLELIQTLNIIKGLGLNRCIIYFVNSTLNFRLAFKSSFNNFNKHLFFPVYVFINNIFKNFKELLLSKLELKKAKNILKKKKFFLLKSGKNLLRKVYISSKWSFGFISNYKSFFKFADNILHEKIKFGKMINHFENNLSNLVDFYPFLPNYGFIGDHSRNYWVVNEFFRLKVPHSSVIDTFSTKSLLSMFGIPGNACSIDSTIFFIILIISNYLIGYYQQIFRFCLKQNLTLFIKLNSVSNKKKNFFFKTLKTFILKKNV